MDSHFTVTVEVKETIPPKPMQDDKGYTAKNADGSTKIIERSVIDRLRVVTSAASEPEAIQRAIDMLGAARA